MRQFVDLVIPITTNDPAMPMPRVYGPWSDERLSAFEFDGEYCLVTLFLVNVLIHNPIYSFN